MDSNLSESSLMDVQGMSIAQFLSITNIDLKPYREIGKYKHFINVKTQHLSQVLCTETSRNDGSEQNRSSKDRKKSSITNNRLNFSKIFTNSPGLRIYSRN